MANDLRVRVLNVGQGDTIVGLLPDAPRAFVVDVYDARPVLNLLDSEGIKEVFLYLSHSDRDHTRGAIDFLTGFQEKGKFSRIFFNRDRPSPATDTQYRLLLMKIANVSRSLERQSPREVLSGLTTGLNDDPRYLAWFGSTVRVLVVHPAYSDTLTLDGQSKNEISGVLMVEHDLKVGTRRTLLTADVQLTGISFLLARAATQPVAADVLKFPHHGAWPADHPGLPPDVPPRTMAEFLAAVAPRAVILSAGFSNSHGHVKPAVFDALRGEFTASRRMTDLLCTQFTPTCLGGSSLSASLGSLCCAGDVEIRTGDSVGGDGLTISTFPDGHADRIRDLVAAGGTPCCAFLRPAGIFGTPPPSCAAPGPPNTPTSP